MKTKNFSLVTIIFLVLFSPSLVLSASTSTSSKLVINGNTEKYSKNVEDVNVSNYLDGETSTPVVYFEKNEPVAIVASDYCKFLNVVASDDTHHLYDKKLGVGSTASCIQRFGTPGYYTYLVTSGDKDKSVLYIDRLSAMRYCNWLQNGFGSIYENTAITEQGSYNLQDDQCISINPEATYFITDGNELLSLVEFYNGQLCSSCSDFHVVNSSLINAKKDSGERSKKTTWKTVEEATVVLGGGGEKTKAPEQSDYREYRKTVAPILHTSRTDIKPCPMMNLAGEEVEKAFEELFTKTKLANKSIRSNTITSATAMAPIGKVLLPREALDKKDWSREIQEEIIKRNLINYNLLGQRVNKISTIDSAIHNAAFSAKGEEAVKLWEKSKKATQQLITAQEQYIASLEEAKAKAPERFKADWNQHIAEAQNKKELIACSILAKEANRVSAHASLIQYKANLTKGEEAAKLWEESKKTTQQLITAQEQYIASLKTAQSKASLSAQSEWNELIEEAQNKKELMICSILAKKANKISTIDSAIHNAAFSAKGEEAAKLWEKSKKATQQLITAQEQYIASLKAAQLKASSVAKVGWNKLIEEAQNKKELIACSILAKEANRVSASVFILQNKANIAQGEEAVKLWEESKNATQKLVEAHDQYIASLKAAQVKAPLSAQSEWKERIEEAQNKKELIACSILAKEANRVSASVFILQNQASITQGEEAVKLWEESKNATQKLVEAHDQYIASLKAAQVKAPLSAQSEWNERIEAAQNKKELIACSILAKEANRVSAIDDIIQDKATQAKGKEAINLWGESKEATQTLIDAQKQYVESLEEAKTKAPERFKAEWNERIEEAKNKKELMICSILAKEANRVSVIDSSAHDKANKARGEEAINLWEASKKATQTLIEALEQYITSLQEAQARAPLTAKEEWNELIEEAKNKKELVANKIKAQSNIIISTANDNTELDRCESPVTVVEVWKNNSRRNSFSSENTVSIFDQDEIPIDDYTKTDISEMADIEKSVQYKTLDSTFEVTEDMFNEALLQSKTASKHATDTIDIIRKIFKILKSKKDNYKMSKLSDDWKKVIAANTAIILAQKKIATSPPYDNNTMLFMELELAIDTVKETTKDATSIIENMINDSTYEREIAVLSSLKTIPFDTTIFQLKSNHTTYLTFYDLSIKKNAFNIELLHAKDIAAYAADTRKEVNALLSFFNNMSEFGNKDLDDMSNACESMDAAKIVVATIEKKLSDRLIQLESLACHEINKDKSFLNDSLLIEYQKVATILLKKATQDAIIIAKRSNDYPWNAVVEKISNNLNNISNQLNIYDVE